VGSEKEVVTVLVPLQGFTFFVVFVGGAGHTPRLFFLYFSFLAGHDRCLVKLACLAGRDIRLDHMAFFLLSLLWGWISGSEMDWASPVVQASLLTRRSFFVSGARRLVFVFAEAQDPGI